ncbi:MAG: hypothetical protein R3211_03605 [Balneolaceae bacterium]|nr:hypothetical protein [Balneolaceae bacterium]
MHHDSKTGTPVRRLPSPSDRYGMGPYLYLLYRSYIPRPDKCRGTPF